MAGGRDRASRRRPASAFECQRARTVPMIEAVRRGGRAGFGLESAAPVVAPVAQALSLRISSASTHSARFRLTLRSMLATGRVCSAPALRAATGLATAHGVLLHPLERRPQAVPEVLGPAGFDQLLGGDRAPVAGPSRALAVAQRQRGGREGPLLLAAPAPAPSCRRSMRPPPRSRPARGTRLRSPRPGCCPCAGCGCRWTTSPTTRPLQQTKRNTPASIW